MQLPSCTHVAVVVTWEVEDLPLSGELQCFKVKAANPLQTVQAGAHIMTVLISAPCMHCVQCNPEQPKQDDTNLLHVWQHGSPGRSL